MLFSLLYLRKRQGVEMISWKHSFKRLNEEYEIAQKKKQALDSLFENGKISQATRDSFDSDISAVIMEIEKQQNTLLTKMQEKTQELETQIKTLEKLLATYEIQHVVGEIEEEMYQREITLISTGLESARHELNIIKEATSQLCPPVEASTTEADFPAEEAESTLIEAPEDIVEAPIEMESPEEPVSQEPAMSMEETSPESPSIENAYVAPEPEVAPQIMEEAPEVVEDQPEVTEEMPQNTEDSPQETELQPQVAEDASQDLDESSEIVEETTEAVEEIPQNVEEAENTEVCQPAEETPQITEDEPQSLEETLQTVEETPTEVYPSEGLKEASKEIHVEIIEDEDQTEAESTDVAEADDETEYEEL